MKKKKIILIAVSLAILAGGGVWLFGGSTAKHKVTYATATVSKGEISESVTATGTIEPVTEVEVGTQVSGIIDKIYVDYNAAVTKGQLIAEMDRVTLQSELASQRATYSGAKAEYEYQKKNYERNKGLHEKGLISDTDYEQSLYNYEKAKSSFESSQASLAKATCPMPPLLLRSMALSSAGMWKKDKRWLPDSRHRLCSPSQPT